MINISLPADRTKPGRLQFVTAEGEVLLECPCLGKADNAMAAKNGNPSRDPTKRYGDTPTGDYLGRIDAVLSVDAATTRSYGPHPVIRLAPASGQAAVAKQNGRVGLLIHGGAPSKAGGLRPTNGCVRVTNDNQAALLGLMRQTNGEARVVVKESA